jgi:hypothetical protein
MCPRRPKFRGSAGRGGSECGGENGATRETTGEATAAHHGWRAGSGQDMMEGITLMEQYEAVRVLLTMI